MQSKVLFKNGDSFMLVAFNVNADTDGSLKSVSLSVAVDKDDDVTTVDDVIDAAESGISSITHEDGTVDEFPIVHGDEEYDPTFVTPDYNVNDSEEYYMGTDEDNNPKYARMVINLELLVMDENYISDLKTKKIVELSNACHKAIENGMEVKLSGGTKKFSYNETDRENIAEMFNAVVIGVTAYPYHEDDGACELFSAADIIAIYTAMVRNKTHHTTYFNQLKQMVKAKTSARQIASVEYGQDLSGKYLEAYNANMTEAATQLQIILSKISGGK